MIAKLEEKKLLYTVVETSLKFLYYRKAYYALTFSALMGSI